jgi:micrococcal nuclease
MKLGIQRYWHWTSTGPKWHWAAGIGGPILGFIFLIAAVSGDPEEEPRSAAPLQVDAPATERPTATQRPAATVSSPTATPSGETATVARVIDGDTIELRNGQRLRYIGIDTPETVDPGQPVGCYGKEASDRNKTLVEGKTVSLEMDVSEEDRFGRLLRYVYLTSGEMVNEMLVAEGYAQSSSYPPDIKHQDRFVASQQQARDAGRGLWGVVCQPTIVLPTQVPVQALPVAPPAQPTTAPQPTTGNCSPPSPPDLDCGEITFRRFHVLAPDPHGFDGNDNDGIGCETG